MKRDLDLSWSDRTADYAQRLQAFMDAHIYPNEALYEEQLHADKNDLWRVPPILLELQARARDAGLWTLHMREPEYGPGLTNLEYAPLAEMMGRVHWAAEVFNCNAPDSGNMDVLAMFGTAEQKQRWLIPMLEGAAKSSFAMTEPGVASSDASNIQTRIERDGDGYVINGHKWWITNAYNPRTRFFIVMGVSDPTQEPHKRHTQILVDRDTPGITLVRPLNIMGYLDQPHGHAEIIFDNVRAPAENVILGEGRGFEVAQGRLGPGRVHHCMRLIGVAERVLERVCRRVTSRVAFGKLLADESIWQERIAEARTDIEMCRLLVYKAALMMDRVGARSALSEIAQIKVAVPRAVQRIIDMAVQAHGAAGMCDDFGLGYAYARARIMRIGDGPDEVHNRTIARKELSPYRKAAA